MSFRMRWLGTACFEIVLLNEKTIVVDPYVDDALGAPISSDQFEGCHYMFITHGHYDHVLDAGKLAERFRPKIFCNEATAGSLIRHQGVDPGLITRARPGDVIREDGLTVEVVPGMHVDFRSEYKRLTGEEPPGAAPLDRLLEILKTLFGPIQVPEKLGEWMAKYPQGEQLNFVFEPDGGRRIYMAGSYPDPSLLEVAGSARAHITLLQVMPGKFLRGLEKQTAMMAVASGCKIVVPQHHDPLFRGATPTDLTGLKRIIADTSDMLFQELVPGKWYSFT